MTTYQARHRPVYLPAGSRWYDFWTGVPTEGGRTVDAPAPFDSLPVYVRAGTILPIGPAVQYIGEKPADPLTLFIYAGADGRFTLYEDDGLTYGYEQSAFARIPLTWDDTTRTLTIGRREGSFPGVLAARTFNVVLVAPGQPAGYSPSPAAAVAIRYDGIPVATRLAP